MPVSSLNSICTSLVLNLFTCCCLSKTPIRQQISFCISHYSSCVKKKKKSTFCQDWYLEKTTSFALLSIILRVLLLRIIFHGLHLADDHISMVKQILWVNQRIFSWKCLLGTVWQRTDLAVKAHFHCAEEEQWAVPKVLPPHSTKNPLKICLAPVTGGLHHKICGICCWDFFFFLGNLDSNRKGHYMPPQYFFLLSLSSCWIVTR